VNAAPLLIFCAGRNRRYAEIALRHGFAYGCRSDYTPLFAPIVLADLDWKRPDRERHLAFVAEHTPHLAVAPDVLALEDLPATLRYAERLAAHADRVLIVPKVAGVMAALPHEPWLVVGYSVPTPYGGADAVLLPELTGWPVHLLGGTPHAQMTLAAYVRVYSADGNSHMRAARYGTFWSGGGWRGGARGLERGDGLAYRAFERSCSEIMTAWQRRAA
jgi:hypothetical protein